MAHYMDTVCMVSLCVDKLCSMFMRRYSTCVVSYCIDTLPVWYSYTLPIGMRGSFMGWQLLVWCLSALTHCVHGVTTDWHFVCVVYMLTLCSSYLYVLSLVLPFCTFPGAYMLISSVCVDVTMQGHSVVIFVIVSTVLYQWVGTFM